jgi:pimeloyl-ACP methyl ester carboxylesterase
MTSLQNAGPRVVLVHGAYADGSSWSQVIRLLHGAGITATAVQNPLTSLAGDAEHTRWVLAQQPGPVILAGHSFAGTVISQAGTHPAVAGLVYVAARAPDAGEDYTALAGLFPAAPASAGLVYADGFGALTEDAFCNDFAGGVKPDLARVLYAVQGPKSPS